MINLPVNFVSDITANDSTLVTDLSDYVTLVIGVLLAVVVIRVIIGAIKN
jgi:hypothetical protein